MNPNDPPNSTDAFPALVGSSYHEPLVARQSRIEAADIAGIRAFAVHAKDEPARRFYEHFGFIASHTDPRHLFLLIKEIRRVAGT
jgi:hypothetical protein